jgi:exosortase A
LSSHKPSDSKQGQSLQLKKILLLILLLGAFLLAYFPVISGLVKVWAHSDDYSHGFFIVPIAAYIIWTKKERLAEIPINSSWSGLVLIVFSLFLYLAAYFAEILTIVSLSMVLFLAGLVLFFYGWQMIREISFPLLLLLFMIPIPSQIYSMATIPLQLFVSHLSVMAASLIGVPVFREGNVIHMPMRTLEVVQACSGLRSLISLLTLGVVIAYFALRSNLLRLLLFISGVPVAIFVNIIRVLVMIIAFHYFDIDLTTDATHTIYGLVIFMLAMAILIGLKGVFSFWDISKTLE